MKFLWAIFALSILWPWPAYAQGEWSATGGISNSVNMGELGPAPVFNSTISVGDRLRLEDGLEYNLIKKYTHAGWYVKNAVDILVFPSNSHFFVTGGMDYRHRNGGQWAKDGIRIGAGAGYDNGTVHYRFSVKDKVISLNDNIDYCPYYEFLVRGDYPLGNSNWNFRAEALTGLFKYTQNNAKRTAFYTNAGFGFAYKWP